MKRTFSRKLTKMIAKREKIMRSANDMNLAFLRRQALPRFDKRIFLDRQYAFHSMLHVRRIAVARLSHVRYMTVAWPPYIRRMTAARALYGLRPCVVWPQYLPSI